MFRIFSPLAWIHDSGKRQQHMVAVDGSVRKICLSSYHIPFFVAHPSGKWFEAVCGLLNRYFDRPDFSVTVP